MAALSARPQLLVTATVRPQTRSVQLLDPDRRLRQYLEALSVVPFESISSMTVIENSGTDFGKELRQLTSKVPVEFICYEETRSDCPIAQLEAGMYSMFLNSSKFLDDTGSILKLTGRYRFKNLNEYLSGPLNVGVSFRPVIRGHSSALLTSIYKMSLKRFRGFESFLRETDFSSLPLESHFANYINPFKTHPLRIQYPIIIGVSGTFATSYEKNYKERARILLSRILPFALSWD